jgi:hypothetical protein
MAEMNVEHLADIEAIKKLKARYFRLMDAKNWAEFGDVFTRDAVLRGGDQEIAGRPAIVEFVSRMSDGVRSAPGFPAGDRDPGDRAGQRRLGDVRLLRGSRHRAAGRIPGLRPL